MRLIKELASLKYTNILVSVLLLEMLLFAFLGARSPGFTTVYFLFPLGLLWVNLGCCTLLRILRKKSWRYPIKSGPDWIHFSLLLVILAALLNPLLQKTGYVNLSEGDSLPLTEEHTLGVEQLHFSTYSDGRPQYYGVELTLEGESRWLEVNRPLRIQGMNLFLVGFATAPLLILENAEEQRVIDLNQPWPLEDPSWELEKIHHGGEQDWRVEFQGEQGTIRVKQGDSLGSYRVSGLELVNRAQLKVMISPITPLFYLSFGFFALGLILLIIDKWKQLPTGDNP